MKHSECLFILAPIEGHFISRVGLTIQGGCPVDLGSHPMNLSTAAMVAGGPSCDDTRISGPWPCWEIMGRALMLSQFFLDNPHGTLDIC